jgi:hypothetical protein
VELAVADPDAPNVSDSGSDDSSSTMTPEATRNELRIGPEVTDPPRGLENQPMKPDGWISPVFESKIVTAPYSSLSSRAAAWSAPALAPR